MSKVTRLPVPARTYRDPLSASAEGDVLLVITFAKSSQPTYDLAVAAASGALLYREETVGKTLVHTAGFERSPEDAVRARTVLGYVGGWKTTKVYAGGKLLHSPRIVDKVLECYLTALGADDPKAHCHRVIDEYENDGRREDAFKLDLNLDGMKLSPVRGGRIRRRYVLPCSFMALQFRSQPGHSATLRDQIQARAVKMGCSWCPRFSADDAREIE